MTATSMTTRAGTAASARKPGKAWTVADLAEQWTCSPRQIYDLIDEGLLVAFSISVNRDPDKKRGLRISDAERLKWEAQNVLDNQPNSSGETESGAPLPSTTIKLISGVG